MHMINRQLGVGLIEVLAALFVLSVGLLGIAGLQAQGLIANVPSQSSKRTRSSNACAPIPTVSTTDWA